MQLCPVADFSNIAGKKLRAGIYSSSDSDLGNGRRSRLFAEILSGFFVGPRFFSTEQSYYKDVA
jgi:hypothetical protein